MIQWFARDWALKLIAFILAVGLWYYALGEEGIEVTRNIPLEISVENDQMSILEASAQSVEVTFIAPRALLSDLTREGVRAVHSIGSEANEAGEYSFRIEAREIKPNSPQIRVVSIEPEVVRVTLDELIVQKLKVEPNFVGEPAIGYVVDQDQIQMNPNAVLVEGPKGLLEKLNSIQTNKIDLVGRVRAFRRTVTTNLPEHVKLLSEALIDIYVPIREEHEEKGYENIPIRILNDSKGNQKVSIRPKTVSFVLEGPKKRFQELKVEKFLAYVEVADLAVGEHEVRVQLILPEDVTLKSEDPLAVQVTIKK